MSVGEVVLQVFLAIVVCGLGVTVYLQDLEIKELRESCQGGVNE